MKTFLQKKALIVPGLLCAALLLPQVKAGTADGTGGSTISSATDSAPRLRFVVGVQEGYNDNVLTTTDSAKTRSAFTTAQGTIFADLGNSRTVFTVGVGGGVTYYYSRPGTKDDRLAHLSVDIVHKVNDRLTLTFNSYNTYQVQPQFDLQVQQNRVNGQYYYTSQSLSASYSWTKRFSTVTSYQVTGIFYEDQNVKRTNDYVQQTFGNQFRYLLYPTTSLVAEYRFGIVSYLYSNGLNSTSNYALLGFDHSFSSKFNITVRGGGVIQDQKTGGTSTSPYAEITTNYQYQRRSSLQGYLNYGFQYSNLALAQTNKALRLGITVNQALTAKLMANIGFFYEHDDYSSAPGTTSFHEDTLNGVIGLSYPVTPRLSLQANYTHTSLLSDVSAAEYKQNVFTLGANYSF